MPIIFHESSNIFHLTNGKVSYVMYLMENGQLEHLYYGKAIRDNANLSRLHKPSILNMACISMPEPSEIGLGYIEQEYPVYGTGDFRHPALEILQENGSRIVNFTYVSHVIYKGKKDIFPLPSTYIEDESEAETLEITLHDEVMDTDLILTYTIFADYPAIARHTTITQKGAQTIVLDRVMSASVEFGDSNYEMLQLTGAWARERYPIFRKVVPGINAIEGLVGTASSAEQNPFLAIKRPDATENHGDVYGFSFVYSGNFLAQVEAAPSDLTRVMMGINPLGFSWPLKTGESFTSPEVVMVYSGEGLNGMSQTYHRLYRTRLAHGVWRDKERPILLNNWEATYFDFNEEKILKIAEKAKETGVELFVLDDGWFGERNDDFRGLGDWFVNTEKLPNGIKGLSEKIEALGMKFGLWVELEMVNKDSKLYREHPDWLIGVPNRYESTGRHQNVLDFSRKEVVDAIYTMISKILRESKISYIKWDMNRYMSEPFSRGMAAADQGTVQHKYTLGVYDLYTRLTTEFPEILFESCASGGARFDPAMLYFAPQGWCSDDTDANERVKIQYGTSYCYPVSCMGSHVSVVPNHQLMRITPLSTRGNVAYFGTFGYELDLNLLTDAEIETVKKQIAFMKENRYLIQIDSDYYRLKSPFANNDAAWEVVSQDKSQAIVMYYQTLNQVNSRDKKLQILGLDPDTLYTVNWNLNDGTENSYEAFGDELMAVGLPISRSELYVQGGDFASILFTIRK